MFQLPFYGESIYQIDGSGINIHPQYTDDSFDFDIALIKSIRPFQITPNSFAACLPKPELDVTGKPLIVSGWGRIADLGYLSEYLKYTILYGISNDECNILYDNKNLITSNMLCAKAKNNDTAHCDGDSGGETFFNSIQLSITIEDSNDTISNMIQIFNIIELLIKFMFIFYYIILGPLVLIKDLEVNNARLTVVGVVNFSFKCSNLDLISDPPIKPHYYPAVYARVSSHLPWIMLNSDAGQCQN